MSTARGNIWVTVYIDDLSIDDSDCNSDAKFLISVQWSLQIHVYSFVLKMDEANRKLT